MELLKKMLAISFASVVAMSVMSGDVSAMKRKKPDFDPADYSLVDGTLVWAKRYHGVVRNPAIVEQWNAWNNAQIAHVQAAALAAQQYAAAQANVMALVAEAN